MAKKVHSVAFKGLLEVDWSAGVIKITETVKEETFEYSLNEILEEFNGKTVTLSLKEEDSIEPIDGLDGFLED